MTNKSESIEFPDSGIFLLWGPSGAGKSSFLEAIGYCLYGINATRANSLDELRHELYPDEDLSVRLTLKADDEQIQVFRGLEKNKSICWMVDRDGTYIEGTKSVNEKITEIMGKMDGPTFFSTYFSQQGELDNLIKMQGANRRKFVQRMLGLNIIDEIVKKISKSNSDFKLQVNNLLESLPELNITDLQVILDKNQGNLENLTQEKSSLNNELDAIKSKGVTLKAKLDVAKENEKIFNDIKPKITIIKESILTKLENDINNLKADLEKINKAQEYIDNNLNKIKELEELKNQEKELASAENSLELLKHLEAELKETLDSYNQIKDFKLLVLEIDVEDHILLEKSILDLKHENIELNTKIKELNNNIKILEHQKICSLCLREVDDDSVLKKLKDKMSDLEEQYNSNNNSLTKINNRLEKSLEINTQNNIKANKNQEHIAQKEALEEIITEKENKIKELKSLTKDATKLAEIREKIQENNKEMVLAENAYSEIKDKAEKESQVKSSIKQKADKEQELEELNKQLKEIDFDLDNKNKIESDYEETRELYIKINNDITNYNNEINKLELEIKNNLEQIKQVSSSKEKIEKIQNQQIKYSKLDISMKEFRAELIGSIRPSLEALTSKNLQELTNGEMSAVSIDNEYNISIKRHGEFRRIGLCSGGEQARAAFACRLALTQLVSARTETPIGFMVFDEIFGSQDEDHRQAILDSLTHLKYVYPQTFLISHQESLKDSPLINLILNVPNSDSENRIEIISR